VTARVDPTTKVHRTAIIGDDVTIGPGCTLGPYSIIEGRTTIGSDNRIGAHVLIGGEPQDQKYVGEDSEVIIGSGNVIREFVTIHRGTAQGGGVTKVGDRNYLMTYVHIGHDCDIADDIIMSNSTQLAGHVHVFRFAHFGGLAGVHQFARIGESAMVGAGAMVRYDVPHYAMARGDRANLVGINEVGLRRRGFSPNRISRIYEFIRILDGGGESAPEGDPDFEKLKRFYRESKDGVTRYKASERDTGGRGGRD